jgi:hypothetical protein
MLFKPIPWVPLILKVFVNLIMTITTDRYYPLQVISLEFVSKDAFSADIVNDVMGLKI